MTPDDLDNCITPPSEASIDTLTKFNGILCTTVENYHRRGQEQHAKEIEQETIRPNPPTEVPWHESRVLRPLFEALMAIVCCADYEGEDSTTAGHFPVHLVRTGVEDGLSAPVSFHDEIAAHRMEYISENVVKTTLEAATGFIMALEAREAAVFGVQPDPASVVEGPKDEEGNELTKLPSTQWVSEENAAKWGWCGMGWVVDREWRTKHEQGALHCYKVDLFSEQMETEGRELPDIVSIDGRIVPFRFRDNGSLTPDKVLRTTFSMGKTTFWDEQDCAFCEADVAKLFAPVQVS